jgi:hypothetical protein
VHSLAPIVHAVIRSRAKPSGGAELKHVDLLLHVRDAASPDFGPQRESVVGVLRDLGIPADTLADRTLEVCRGFRPARMCGARRLRVR